MLKELEITHDFLENEPVNTIYFGGGTPSVLTGHEISLLTEQVIAMHPVTDNAEITLEANPDDLTDDYLKRLKDNTRINRLSIGIQSFIDRDLKLMNRRHNAGKARESVNNSLALGFSNISIDLIYGIPGMSLADWEYSLKKAFSLRISHLSAYHLTIEKGTVFYDLMCQNKLSKESEDDSLDQFRMLIKTARRYDFMQYEISNFARDGMYSVHNSNYWKRVKYLGIGPSAHSYNIGSRRWNVSDNHEYISKITRGEPFFESEILDETTRYNEYVMTGLRTMWGIKLNEVHAIFGQKFYDHLLTGLQKFLSGGEVTENGEVLLLSEKGKFISDYIISELLVT